MAGQDRWLTPNSPPASTTCRVLFMPDDPDWIAIVSGALIPLVYENNFEAFGTATPAQCAAIFADMFDKFSFNQGVCRVIGEIIAYAGSSSPDPNWLVCDGSSLDRTAYNELFVVIGTTYGSVDSSHFNLPDFQGRSPMGAGAGSGLSPRSVGDSIGEENHTLTLAETAAHTHTDAGHTHTEGIAAPAVGAAIAGVPIPSAIPAVGVTGLGFAGLSTDGGGNAHNTIHPALVILYLIVART